ncbi:crossover junction endodeoxyribonuclease RuvC [Patescibacteria group bacterium]|nr:crossover junction endodeoxyribonuclease RuvC [Patescibacteria group bacterium]MCL5010210.1 crossover junction endodeoxyribonuclease RuvC [Patescibacteria group bacterium]
MTILGIDPGIGRTGWGVIKCQMSNVKCQMFDCIETSSSLAIEKRLAILYEEMTQIIRKYKPDVLAIEELFFNTNAKTAFMVGQARGVVLLAAGQNSLPVFVYTPLQVKMAITGYGRAEKSQIGQMVKVLLKLKEIPKLDDITDALAVAVTHSFTKRYTEN